VDVSGNLILVEFGGILRLVKFGKNFRLVNPSGFSKF